jgi:hypothetical protein
MSQLSTGNYTKYEKSTLSLDSHKAVTTSNSSVWVQTRIKRMRVHRTFQTNF